MVLLLLVAGHGPEKPRRLSLTDLSAENLLILRFPKTDTFLTLRPVGLRHGAMKGSGLGTCLRNDNMSFTTLQV